MAEESKHDKYIICSKCKSKYINDEEHISNDFGYTRLEERYKTCVRCRVRNKVNCKTYYDKHIEELKEYSKTYREEHLEERKEYDKQYRENNIDRLREYDRARGKVKAVCENCGKEFCKTYLSKHQCKTNQFK